MTKSRTVEQSVAVSSYFIIGMIWYIMDENVRNSFTKHHVKQAMNYTLISYLVYILIITLEIFIIIPSSIIFTNPVLSIIIHCSMGMIIFFFFSLYVIQTHAIFSNKKGDVPFIGKLADKYMSF